MRLLIARKFLVRSRFFRARDRNEAVAIANDSNFGLGASVWTNDAAEQEFFSHELQSGMVFVNAMVASDPRVPFGGDQTIRLRPRAGCRSGSSRVYKRENSLDCIARKARHPERERGTLAQAAFCQPKLPL